MSQNVVPDQAQKQVLANRFAEQAQQVQVAR